MVPKISSNSDILFLADFQYRDTKLKIKYVHVEESRQFSSRIVESPH